METQPHDPSSKSQWMKFRNIIDNLAQVWLSYCRCFSSHHFFPRTSSVILFTICHGHWWELVLIPSRLVKGSCLINSTVSYQIRNLFLWSLFCKCRRSCCLRTVPRMSHCSDMANWYMETVKQQEDTNRHSIASVSGGLWFGQSFQLKSSELQ